MLGHLEMNWETYTHLKTDIYKNGTTHFVLPPKNPLGISQRQTYHKWQWVSH